MPSTRVASQRARDVAPLVAACGLWGLSFPVTKALAAGAEWAAPHLSTWFSSAYMVGARFLIAGLLLFLVRPGLPSPKEITQGVALGISTGIGMLLQTDALSYTEASTSAFLTQGYVVLLPLVSLVGTRRAPPVRVTLSALVVLLGLAILSRFDPRSFSLGRGEAETLAAAACFTVQILLVGAPGFASNRSRVVTVTMFASIAVCMLPILVHTVGGASDWSSIFAVPGSRWYFAGIVLLPTLGSFSLMNRYQSRVSPSEAGIVYAAEPVFTSASVLFLPGWLSQISEIAYPNEVLDARLVVGGVLVVGANVLLALGAREATQAGGV